MHQPDNLQSGLSTSVPAPRGKVEWFTWLIAMSTAAVMMACLYIFNSPGVWWMDYMTWAITAMFAWTLWKSFKAIVFLDRETRLAGTQVAVLASTNDIDRFLAEAKPSVFRTHISSLHTIFLNDTNIDQGHLIEITHARLTAQNRVVELLSSMLITLGLIGTIIGLLISIGGLGGVLGGGGEALKNGLKTTISGLGTAFYTTLFGAACGGVILRILTAIVDSHILRYIAHLSELTEVHVLPALRRTAARLEAAGYYKRLDEIQPLKDSAIERTMPRQA